MSSLLYYRYATSGEFLFAILVYVACLRYPPQHSSLPLAILLLLWQQQQRPTITRTLAPTAGPPTGRCLPTGRLDVCLLWHRRRRRRHSHDDS